MLVILLSKFQGLLKGVSSSFVREIWSFYTLPATHRKKKEKRNPWNFIPNYN